MTANRKHEAWQWNGAKWHGDFGGFYPDIDGEILGWIPMPQMLEEQKSANNESCITGMSGSGHCGAAACCSNEYACCLQCPDEGCNGRCGWIDAEVSE